MTAYQATWKRSNPNALPPRLAGKLLAFILALTLVVGLLVCGIDKAFAAPLASDIHPAPAPKTDVSVQGENIRLGDVFEGVTQNADFVLAPAPQPGQELVWNTSTLLRIATAFDLPWRPQDGDEIHIRRDASLIDSGTLKSMIRDYLSRDAGADSFNIAFTSEVPQIIVPDNGTPRIQLADFNMQPLGGTFSAIVKVSDAAGQHAQTVNLRGVAERVITVPVLKSAMHNGEIIQASDVIYVTRKASAVGPNFVRAADELVGSTPRRAIPAGELIRPDSVQAPQMVNRGDLVTMVYNQNGMYLTVGGRALEDGAMGQTIKVANSKSNRTIEARVTNTKEVTVN